MEATSYLIRLDKKQKKLYEDAAYRNRMTLREWILSELDNAATYNPPALPDKKFSFKPRTIGASAESDIIDVERL